MQISKTRDRVRAWIAFAALTPLVAGCALSDDNLSRVMVAPGKFRLYTCPELITKAKELATRARDLEGVMAKAHESAGGGVVSTLAYRPDYVQVRGEMRDVREAAADKRCDLAAIESALGAGRPSAPR
jgi:hypothetical protein